MQRTVTMDAQSFVPFPILHLSTFDLISSNRTPVHARQIPFLHSLIVDASNWPVDYGSNSILNISGNVSFPSSIWDQN